MAASKTTLAASTTLASPSATLGRGVTPGPLELRRASGTVARGEARPEVKLAARGEARPEVRLAARGMPGWLTRLASGRAMQRKVCYGEDITLSSNKL